MNRKLEILVVEDNPENLAVAKKYFNSQTDLNVDYATYRDEAIEMLEKNKYDGVITDRSIPGTRDEFNTKDEREGFAKEIYEQSIGKDVYDKNNGWLIALNSEIKDISWVIHTEHGNCLFFYPIENWSNEKPLIKETYDLFITSKNLEDFNSKLKNKEICNAYIESYLRYEKKFDYLKKIKRNRIPDLIKQNPESWKIALDYLKQAIESKK